MAKIITTIGGFFSIEFLFLDLPQIIFRHSCPHQLNCGIIKMTFFSFYYIFAATEILRTINQFSHLISYFLSPPYDYKLMGR